MLVLKKLWSDQDGFVVSTELVLLATVVVIGLIVGMATVRDAATAELSDVAGAVSDVNQSYRINGILGHTAATAGFDYADQQDFCDQDNDSDGEADNCVTVQVPALPEDVLP